MNNTEELVHEDLQNRIVEDKIIHNGEIVEDGVKSPFWQEIVGPELHKLISTTGSYQNPDGSWVAGHWARPSTDPDTRTYNAGYQAGLMEFSNAILSFIRTKDQVIAKRVKRKTDNQSELTNPMLEEY